MASTTLLTAADLWNLPDSGLPDELVRGVLHIVTPAAAAHGSISSRLLAALAAHVYPRRLGELFTESTGFLLERNPDTVRCPDLAFVARRRLPPGGLGPGFLELAPDLAVEIVSKGDTHTAVMAKVADYLRLGVRCVWVVFPAERAVRIFDPQGSETLAAEHDLLEAGEILPAFRCPVAPLFSALRR